MIEAQQMKEIEILHILKMSFLKSYQVWSKWIQHFHL